MCGFTAAVGWNGSERLGETVALAARLRHRGPDDDGAVALGRAALAHRRLSIIDVRGGRQPITNEDGTLALVCNGEIYNYASLRERLAARHAFRSKSDSEVILHLHEELGDACVRELDGMFAFVLTDGQRFLAARDPLGIKPLYVARDADGLQWFSSELKGLPARCVEVHELAPGTVLTERGPSRWFTPAWTSPPAPRDVSEEQDVTDVRRALERAVDKRLMSDVPLGVFLSGGLDSSVIAALVRRRISDLHSFAVGLPGSPDLVAARRVADHLGTQHHEYVYTPAEAARAVEHVIEHLESFDPALIESAVPCWFVSKLASEHVKVVLSGEGADEVFAGYGYFADIGEPAALHRECARLLLALHNMNLQRVDRMTMACGLEGRVPFLDVDFVGRAMAIDPARKLRTRAEKWLLRSGVGDLLPSEIVWRTKQEFADGCGSAAVLRAHGAGSVTDADFARRADVFPVDTPATKQAYAYRRTFEASYPGAARRATVGRWRGRGPEGERKREERWPTTP